MSPADVVRVRAQLTREFGLDQPIMVQYLAWVREVIFHGSLGYSFVNSQPSLGLILGRFGATMELMSVSLVLSLVVGVPLGIVAALRRNRLTDYLVSAFGISAAAVPSFFLGLALIYVFSIKLKVLAPGDMFTPGQPRNALDDLRHLTLPAVVLGLGSAGPILRYVRTSILETLGREYLVTARAKGLAPSMVIIKHAFPNALLPLITVVGLQVGQLVAGAFITEQVFNWPGMGRMAYNAIVAHDYPVIQAFAIVVAVMVLLGNVLSDVAYGFADPRIRLE
jgi:peptide/nickel transport system permease protein